MEHVLYQFHEYFPSEEILKLRFRVQARMFPTESRPTGAGGRRLRGVQRVQRPLELDGLERRAVPRSGPAGRDPLDIRPADLPPHPPRL